MPVVLAVAERNGELDSSAIVVPDGGRWKVSVIGIPTEEYEDPSRGLEMIFKWHDTGVWKPKVGITWKGQVGGFVGRGEEVNPNPAITMDLTALVAKQVKVSLVITGTLTFGIDVSQV